MKIVLRIKKSKESILQWGIRVSEIKRVIPGRIYHIRTKRRDRAARDEVNSKEICNGGRV